MRFRTITSALFACLALVITAAQPVQAAQGDGWTTGTTENQTSAGTLIANGVHEPVKCRKHGTSSLILTGIVAGQALEWTIGAVDCLEKAGSASAATIDNTLSKGHSEGVFTLTNVKVQPATCSVSKGEITTNRLTDEVIMDPTAGSTTVFDRFFTDKRTEGGVEVEEPLATITLEGVECPLAGVSIPWKGSFCGESVHTNAAGTAFEVNKTGTLTKVQTLLFGAAQQTTANTAAKPCAMTIANKPAQLTGPVDFELESAKPFGAD